MGNFIKASSVRDGHRAMRRRFGEDVFDQAVSRLSPEDQSHVSSLATMTMYPLVTDGRLQQHLADIACENSRPLADRFFREAAAMQADDMLNGVFSVFARFVSPRQAFDKAGSILTSVYTEVSSETKASQDGRGGTITIRGLHELTYAGPWLAGWMERALARFGAKTARVTERAWDRGVTGSPELVFDVRWE